MEPVSKWFDALYISHAQKLVKMAVRMGFSEQDGQDLMQDAFLLLLSKAELFRNGHDNPTAFLILTQKHLIGDAIRRRERRKFTSYEALPERGAPDTYFPSLRDSLLPGLSEADMELLIAYYEEQATYEDLAKRLGIPEGQCRVKLFRAKNRYRKILLAANEK